MHPQFHRVTENQQSPPALGQGFGSGLEGVLEQLLERAKNYREPLRVLRGIIALDRHAFK